MFINTPDLDQPENNLHSDCFNQNQQCMSASKCPYHLFKKDRTVDHNSPMPPDRFDFQSFMEEEGNQSKNISYEMMFNKSAFSKQSYFYRGQHKSFMFHRPKVGDRSDRVYSYYNYRDNWKRDRYLSKSQEADHKTLQSREGRKLNLGAYHAKMSVV